MMARVAFNRNFRLKRQKSSELNDGLLRAVSFDFFDFKFLYFYHFYFNFAISYVAGC